MRRPTFEPLEHRHLLAITVSISDPTPFAEGDSGTTNMVFVVSRAGDTVGDLRVNYRTVDGTAVAPTDYTATTGTLTIPAGQTSGTISVPVVGNTTTQSSRAFSVALSEVVENASFANPQLFAAGTSPRSVVASDLNGDGKPDLLVANTNSANVSVLLNTTATGATTASFSAQQTFGVFSGGTFPQIVAAEDINGDGRPDLLVTNSSANGLAVLINTTTPGATSATFAAQQTFAAGTGTFGVDVEDLNGDGRPDVVVSNYNSGTNTVSVLRNTTAIGSTTASFAAQQTFNAGTYSHSVAAADVNGDGKSDLVATNDKSATVSVLLNTTTAGATTFSFAARQTVSVSSYPRSVAVGDINGDGKPDLATANQAGFNASIVINQTVAGSTTISFSSPLNVAAGSNPFGAALGDINADGRSDVLIANFAANSISALLNTVTPGASTPTFAAQQTFGTDNGDLFIALADINGDGRPDVLSANFNANTVSVLLNTTPIISVTANLAAQQTFAAGSLATASAAADLNGDGRPDMLFGNYNTSSVSVELNTTSMGATTASFAAQQTFANGTGTLAVTAADINGDGRPDLLVANYGTGSAGVFVNSTVPGATSASFAAQQTFSTSGTNPRAITVGDVNGDGKLDLILANRSSTNVSVFVNTTAAGSTTASFAAAQTFATGSAPRAVAVADFNGDGRIDIVVGNQSSSNISVLLNATTAGSTTANFAAQQSFAADGGPRGVAVGDFNGDGRPDVVAVGTSAAVFLNTTSPGATTFGFAAIATFAVGSLPVPVVARDLNGDGRADLVVGNYASSTVSVLLNQTAAGATTPSFTAQQTFATGTNPQSMAMADFNGDGKVDVLVGNRNANSMGVLFNQITPLALGTTTATGTISDDDFPVAGSMITITGTSAADLLQLSFNAGGTLFTVQLNSSAGRNYLTSAVNQIAFNGAGGYDSAVIALATTADTANLSPAALHLTNALYTIDLTSAEAIYLYGNSSDTSTFADSAANDIFLGHLYDSGSPTERYYSVEYDAGTSGGVYRNQTTGFRSETASSSNGGTDAALLYDSIGNDTYTSSTGSGSSNITTAAADLVSANGFRNTYGLAYFGGTDTSTQTDTLGTATFFSFPTYTVLQSASYFNESIYFESMIGTSVAGGSAIAYMYDSTGNDAFTGNPTFSTLTGPASAPLTGATFSQRANNFAKVYATSYQGGTDSATLNDSAGADTFSAFPNVSQMSGSGFLEYVINFKNVTGVSSQGGTDVAQFNDLAGSIDTFASAPRDCTLTGAGSSYVNRATGFYQVFATASDANDTASFQETTGADYFYGKGGAASQCYLLTSNSYNTVLSFRIVTANRVNGGSDTRHLDSIDFALTMAGGWVDV